MNMHTLILQSRSYRKFAAEPAVTRELMLKWIDNARLTMSSVNIQPIKYYLSSSAKTNAAIRPHTHWAKNLKNYDGPQEGENPTGYILVCVDGKILNANVERFAKDIGIVSQTIMLSAAEDGFGGCMIGSFDKGQLHELFKLSETTEIALVLALGKPDERIVLEDLKEGEPFNYYRDENNVHHVPKRLLNDIAFDLNVE